MKPRHYHKIDFESFSGYLNYLGYYQGYGGLQWNSMYEVQDSFINQHTWCDTGYNNVLDGHGEAITLGTGGFQAYDLNQTFNLVQGTFASAWESNQPVYFNSYTYTYGQGFTLKASDMIMLSENTVSMLGNSARTINFGNYGTDFKNISAVSFVSGVGQGGNNCSYGQPTYGYILVMDDLVYKLNYTNAAHAHHLPRPHNVPTPQGIPHLNAMFAPTHHTGETSHQQADHHAPAHDHGGLTTSFMLPQAEHHFGF